MMEKQEWPYLSLVSKMDSVVPNGITRKQFPNPLIDKSILLVCYSSDKERANVRHLKMPNSIGANSEIFLSRYDDTENESEICPFYITLDHILIQNSVLNSKCMMICDIRDHYSKWLPDEVAGFWIRFLCPKNKFTFQISLWQSTEPKRKGKLQKDQLMKVNELHFEISNAGPIIKKPIGRVKFAITSSFLKKNFTGSQHLPTFCNKDTYMQIVSSLHDCVENGKFSEFSELHRKFTDTTINDGHSLEYGIFLSIEKSWFYAVSGEYMKAKKLLQEVVGNIFSKTQNKIFLLNRCYSVLANVHLMEENAGTAEDCINMLQVDKKNGIPYEDHGYFCLLHGEMMMNFGKKLPELREKLQKESLISFKKAEISFEESMPHSFHRICKLNLLRARLFICKHYSSCCGSNIEQANFYKNKVMDHVDEISLRTKCHLLLVQSECFFYEGNYLDAEEKLKECNELLELFPEFKIIYNKMQQQRENIEDRNHSSAMCHVETDNSDDSYDADESS